MTLSTVIVITLTQAVSIGLVALLLMGVVHVVLSLLSRLFTRH